MGSAEAPGLSDCGGSLREAKSSIYLLQLGHERKHVQHFGETASRGFDSEIQLANLVQVLHDFHAHLARYAKKSLSCLHETPWERAAFCFADLRETAIALKLTPVIRAKQREQLGPFTWV